MTHLPKKARAATAGLGNCFGVFNPQRRLWPLDIKIFEIKDNRVGKNFTQMSNVRPNITLTYFCGSVDFYTEVVTMVGNYIVIKPTSSTTSISH